MMKNTLLSMSLDDKTNNSSLASSDTIVAISTPMGVGAISIVRLSGDNSLNILKKLTKKNTFKPRYAHLCKIYTHIDSLIDEAIVLYFPSPHSYTTQDMCEIQCHGGMANTRLIVESCISYGARAANAGEFTKLAFINGRIDFSQAQAISDIINTQSAKAAQVLARTLSGELGKFIDSMRESVLELLAFSEVHIDYSDEDLGDDYENMRSKLTQIQSSLQQILQTSSLRSNIITGFVLSIVGKPNVGKSSLLNALLGQDRAIVSEIAGTTRDSIEENLNINGTMVKIIDTAGIRNSDEKIEQIGIEKSKNLMQKSDIVLALFDGSKELDSQDFAIIKLLNNLKEAILLVIINKNDLPQKINEDLLKTHIYIESTRYLSISTKGQIQRLLNVLEEIVQSKDIGDSVMLCSNYQIESIRLALACIANAFETLENGELELFSYHLKDCLNALTSITRPYSDSELLDKLFSQFCLGK